MQDRKVSLGQFLTMLLSATFFGFVLGGLFFLLMDWGAYTNLMNAASDATKRGEAFVIFDLTHETNDFPVIMNEIAFANMIDLKLKEIQDEEVCRPQQYIEPIPRDPLLEAKL